MGSGRKHDMSGDLRWNVADPGSTPSNPGPVRAPAIDSVPRRGCEYASVGSDDEIIDEAEDSFVPAIAALRIESHDDLAKGSEREIRASVRRNNGWPKWLESRFLGQDLGLFERRPSPELSHAPVGRKGRKVRCAPRLAVERGLGTSFEITAPSILARIDACIVSSIDACVVSGIAARVAAVEPSIQAWRSFTTRTANEHQERRGHEPRSNVYTHSQMTSRVS